MELKDKESLLLLKKKAEILLEDLEVITISLSVTKERLKLILSEDQNAVNVELIEKLENQIKLLLESQEKIKFALYNFIYDKYQSIKNLENQP